jgi:NAD+ synthase
MEPMAGQSTDLHLDTAIVRRILVDFVADAIRSAGFGRGVLGLSGGVDSSLTAYLAAEAIGPGNLLGVAMPSATTDPRNMEHASLVANRLGISLEIVDITPMVQAHASRIPSGENVRMGNIMARERMIVLYDLSARDGSLVLGTSNKTETLLGYGTLFGDMACALNPLGDLYKTQVWQLATEIGVPDVIVTKPPSADLWTGQTDEGDLGFTYREVDRLLYAMVDQRKSEKELFAMGFPREFVAHVQSLIRRNQFKRRPPLVAKISGRTTNVDFRYPRDWGV